MTPAQKLTHAVRKLLSLHGWFSFKCGAAGSRDKFGNFFTIGTPGAPDLVATKNGRCLLIEIKAGRDSLKPSQLKFQQQVEAAGTAYNVVREAEDVLKLL